VYDPCATQIIDADNPVMLAPRLTHIHTTGVGIDISVTIRRPVASKMAYPRLLKNIAFL